MSAVWYSRLVSVGLFMYLMGCAVSDIGAQKPSGVYEADLPIAVAIILGATWGLGYLSRGRES